ncbi:MAG: NUDIX hydrolase N-terminal domain-containing protein [Succinivibrio sp.]
MLNRYKHVLFDLDGTIYNTEYAYTMALFDVVKEKDPNTKETFESLTRFMGSSAADTNRALNYTQEDFQILSAKWAENVRKYAHTIKPFEGVLGVIRYLKEKGIKLGIITSRARKIAGVENCFASPLPAELSEFFDISISASDVEHPKPAPDSIIRYMEITGATRDQILFIGDTQSDIDCARASGVDFGLALWGSRLSQSVRVTYSLLNPWDIVGAIFSYDNFNSQIYRWAKEIQAIGQIGLTYSQNVFDIQRFERLREIASEMVSEISSQPIEKVRLSICADKGYITPKIDTRAAVFNGNSEILLVQEAKNGLWSLPGGWCDENESIFSNTVKEVREEAGMIVTPYRFVGMLDKDRWNKSSQPFHILAAFTICRAGDGEFMQNEETLQRKFFAFDDIPVAELRVGTTTIEQIKMCFDAYRSEHWVPVID